MQAVLNLVKAEHSRLLGCEHIHQHWEESLRSSTVSINRPKAWNKDVFPAPFGPTSKVSGAKGTVVLGLPNALKFANPMERNISSDSVSFGGPASCKKP